MKVLALEPYYGGSHQAFLDGWSERSRHDWTLLTLPARKWKWRMRQSAPTFAWDLEERVDQGDGWDVVFCSDMLNLCEFKGLAPASVRELPAVIYFHENQLTYPVRFEREWDYQFGMTNLLSGAAADAVWFNSRFHLEGFLAAIPKFLKKMPDHRPLDAVDRIRARAQVEPPAIEIPAEEPKCSPAGGRSPRILWSARWEFDKNPEEFFAALAILVERDVDFRLLVLGEQFEDSPEVFDRAREELSSRIEHWGYLEDREAYRGVAATADLYVSTAIHEFFGLGALEAMAAGAYPLLPKRLAYPELLDLETEPAHAEFFFTGGAENLADALVDRIERWREGTLWASERPSLRPWVERHGWDRRAAELDSQLERLREKGGHFESRNPEARGVRRA